MDLIKELFNNLSSYGAKIMELSMIEEDHVIYVPGKKEDHINHEGLEIVPIEVDSVPCNSIDMKYILRCILDSKLIGYIIKLGSLKEIKISVKVLNNQPEITCIAGYTIDIIHKNRIITIYSYKEFVDDFMKNLPDEKKNKINNHYEYKTKHVLRWVYHNTAKSARK